VLSGFQLHCKSESEPIFLTSLAFSKKDLSI
jgi:hypothetical protein